MIERSEAYKRAIVADARRILAKAIIDIIDPDIVYGEVNSSGESKYSNAKQLIDKIFVEPQKNATLEKNRWILSGDFNIYPENVPNENNYKFMTEAVSGDDGNFRTPQYAEITFSNVSILQACSLFFTNNEYDGVPEDFVVEVKRGGTAYYTKEFVGNKSHYVNLDGFTVYNPDAIRITVTKTSIPNRRFRMVEIVPGIYEEWDGDMFAELSVKHQADISCTSLPYGTCVIRMDNLSRRFEPRSKNGVFQSIEERQGIDVSMAVRLEDGTDEFKRVGVFYQNSGGWKTGDNGLTMQWNLVDIVGLLADREYIPPETLPTTLEGWISSLVSQLGVNFENKYRVDPNYSGVSLTVNEANDVIGKKCGEILRFVCMATGTFPRADAETGYLACEPLWSEGNKITLENLNQYPIMKANKDVAAIVFTLNDGNGTQYVLSGNSAASSETLSIQNPFIKTKEEALKAARSILSAYGGNQIEIVGRGDMANEVGDVDTIWLNESTATTARRTMQDLSLTEGVLKNRTSILVQADGSFAFENRAVITNDQVWTAPSGVTQLRLILVGAGKDGADGTDGSWEQAGVDGIDGLGGKVWHGTININASQTFNVSISENGTVFGDYSSENGRVYAYGFTDIQSGDSFARTGVKKPIPNSGDGGAKGAGGKKGKRHKETITVETENPDTGETERKEEQIIVFDNYPSTGEQGVHGALGCVVVYWDKETT